MAIKVKSATETAAKWVRRTSAASSDYKAGVSDPGVNWAAAAGASGETYAAGVQDAIGRGAFGKGVAKAGNEKWQRKASEVGAARFAPGVSAGQGDMEKGVAPVLEAISRIDLGPRGPRGDPRNYERSREIGEVLSKLRKK